MREYTDYLKALNLINDYSCCPNCKLRENQGCQPCLDAYDHLESFIVSNEKYRWHDLLKDPEDLPHPEDTSVMYECVLENHIDDASYPAFYFDDEYTKQFGYYNSAYAVRNGADEFETIEDMQYEKVIAWREIEHFKREWE